MNDKLVRVPRKVLKERERERVKRHVRTGRRKRRAIIIHFLPSFFFFSRTSSQREFKERDERKKEERREKLLETNFQVSKQIFVSFPVLQKIILFFFFLSEFVQKS